jgi:hypothetical protein
MTQDEIIEMARQAGGVDITNTIVGVTVVLGADRPEFLEAFAKLVAAAEREVCAQVCDEIHKKEGFYEIGQASECAEAIRARGEA